MTVPEPLHGRAGAQVAALDHQVLEGLRDAMGDVHGEFITSLVAVYESQAVELISAMSNAAQQADTQTLGFAAHSLKGSSANVGGSRVAALCAQLEHWDGKPEELPTKVATLRSELATLLSELDAFLRR